MTWWLSWGCDPPVGGSRLGLLHDRTSQPVAAPGYALAALGPMVRDGRESYAEKRSRVHASRPAKLPLVRPDTSELKSKGQGFVLGGFPRAVAWVALTILLLATAFASGPRLENPDEFMAAAPAGQVETGVPSFLVFGTEAIGFQHTPTGLHLLPDGRVLVTAPGELAFTDGIRWEVFRAGEGEPMMPREALVDNDGSIYFSVPGALGRVEFGTNGLWHTRPVVSLPEALRGDTLSSAISLGQDWYWLGGGGSFVKWRPGNQPTVIPNQTTLQRIFVVNGELYGSEQTSGGLYRLSRNGERVIALDRLSSSVITAAVSFDEHRVLVATGGTGLRLFDGVTFSPFGGPAITAGGLRIADLCAVGHGCFAAAVDTRGIVFFDHDGRVLQILDARLDHRLARVQKLRYSPEGVLWAMLAEGVARIQFPSRISRFEPIIPGGLSYVAPFRHEGRLWFLAEGRTLRGEYDQADRLDRFAVDNPPGAFVFTMASVGDDLFACTDAGIFVRRDQAWAAVAKDIVNARVGITRTPTGQLVYAARGEIGTLERTSAGAFIVHRQPVASLGDSYGAKVDGRGIAWLELGAAGIGRLDPSGAQPVITVHGASAGLPQGWPGVFVFQGFARVFVAHHLYRFDPATDRFVADDAFERRFPQFVAATTRPEVAPDGRVWYTQHGFTWILDPEHPEAAPVKVNIPFAPVQYTFETDGTVWLRGDRLFARYDPRAPASVAGNAHAVITSVQFPNSNRQLFKFGDIGVIPYADNTIVFRFAAPGNPFASSTTFQVELEGVTDRWVPVGTTGQAIFNRLKEGNYVFRVRTVDTAGAASEPARLAFHIAPPWFRTRLAWISYVVAGLGLLAFSVSYPALRQRRQKAYLESLVAKRTEELNKTNQQLEHQIEATIDKSNALAASEENYRVLNAELERRVTERTAELSRSNQDLRDAQQKLAATYKELVDASRMAGMAEVATSVLHNVGNVLNSLNVSANLIATMARNSKLDSLRKLSALLEEHGADLGTFLVEDPKGRRVPELLKKLGDMAATEREQLMAEIVSLQKSIDHIKEIVTMQQSHAKMLGITETIAPELLFEDAIRMNAAALARHRVTVVREFHPTTPVCVEKGKVLQILVNLIRNAQFACDEVQAQRPREKTITLRTEATENHVRFIVRDNGIGIQPENLTKIFALGFTTRSHGHGFGLHSSALAAREMKGSLKAESAGRGEGATFTLEIPIVVNAHFVTAG